jgi:DNA-binding transcriptional regulator LsrR (DeoR family)
MDPEANLQEQRQIVANILHHPERRTRGDVQRLAELVEALDQWIVGGAFLPVSWGRTMPRTPTPYTGKS